MSNLSEFKAKYVGTIDPQTGKPWLKEGILADSGMPVDVFELFRQAIADANYNKQAALNPSIYAGQKEPIQTSVYFLRTMNLGLDPYELLELDKASRTPEQLADESARALSLKKHEDAMKTGEVVDSKPVLDPAPPPPPEPDHTGMESVDPYQRIWRPKRLTDLYSDELKAIVKAAVQEALK